MNRIISPYTNEDGLILGFYGGKVTEKITAEGYPIFEIEVEMGFEPTIGYDQVINGQIQPATEEQINNYWNPIKWSKIRIDRNMLLQQTDYRVTNNLSGEQVLPEQDYQELLTYRQALRDITDTFDNPDDVIWPTKPAFI